jgi:hypothetical protein
MSTSDVKNNFAEVKSCLDQWTIAALSDGKIAGRGYGYEIQYGDFAKNCGDIMIIEDLELTQN